MMNKRQLQEILSAPFHLEAWRNVLFEVFGANNFNQQPQPILLPQNNNKAESAYELGSFNTADDRLIGLYQVNVLPNVWIERNKVGLRELLRHIYKYDVDGALIVFVQQDKWRLSFVSEIRAFDEDGNLTTVATEPKRYTYLLGKDEKTKTPVDRLYSLAGKPIALEDIRNAFSVEALNEEFYKIVAQHFYQLVGATAGKGKKRITYERILQLPGIDPSKNESNHIYQEFAVRLIGRIIFSWFLKMKKSDAGVPLLPEELLSSQAVRKYPNYYHTILERLFFQILNTPIEQRVKNLPEGSEQIPFLNGGLFEPHQPYDFYVPHSVTGLNQNQITLKIPDEWFFNFFQELEKYNFTIDENSVVDVEISVDPEMLGRIFENLLAEIDPDSGETARKATGSYYTPREIVDYMATESLLYYLNSKTDIDIEKLRPIFKMDERVSFPQDDREKILDALDQLKVLDPACGSGAFPIGVMQKIVMALQKLDPDATWWKERQISRIENAVLRNKLKEKLDQSTVEYARKLGIIQNSLFGVDIQPIAAEISKLRCFLTLIVDENIDENKPNRGVEPLPNLEFKFVTANTLIGLPKSNAQGHLFDNYEELNELKKLRKAYLQSYGEEKERIKQQFLEIQEKVFKDQLRNSGGNTETRAFKLSSWNPFDHSKTDWFDPEWMFGEKDFDIVIGNPPYVEHKKLKGIAVKLKSHYKVYTGSSDLSVYFFERGFYLLKRNGTLCYISTNKYFNTDYGKALRKFLSGKLIHKIINFEQVEIFKGILVSTAIIFSSNSSPSETHKFRYSEFSKEKFWKTDFEKKIISRALNFRQRDFSDAEWFFKDGNETQIKSKIENVGIPIKKIKTITIKRGVTTGYDPAFIINKSVAEKLGWANIIKPLLKGRNIKKYNIFFENIYLINSHNGLKNKLKPINLKRDYPKIYEYLNKIDIDTQGKVKNRADKGKHWTNLRNCAFLQLFEKDKIVWPLTADKWGFSLDYKKHYLTSGAFFLVSSEISLKYILAILNSKLMEYYFKFIGVMTAGGAYTLKKATIERFPLVTYENVKPFEVIVDYILFLNSIDSKNINEFVPNRHIVAVLEEIIDGMVFELYFKEDFEKANISFIKYVERDFPPFEGLSEEEKIKTIQSVYQKLRQKDNEIMNNLKLMNIRLADLIGPIKAVG